MSDLNDLAAKGYGPSATLNEVPRKALTINPYRKPTQVSGMSILRRASQISSRNSTKWPRIFGRRGASQEVSVKWPNRLFI